jgi:hypothetical protein
MLVGHVAVGLASKRLVPRASLGLLVLASLLADLLWGLFMVAGIERVEFVTRGPTLMTSVLIQDVSFSHSLLTGAIWGILFAATYFLTTRDRAVTWILLVGVLSHFVLDWISHNPDMPLAPGVQRRYGLGLWNSIPATLLVEGLLWGLAVGLYCRATRATRRVGGLAFWIGVGLLTAAWYNNIAGPPPRGSSAAMGAQSLIFFAVVTSWAFWLNRVRSCRSQ